MSWVTQMAVEFVPIQSKQAQSPAMATAWDEVNPIGTTSGPDGTSGERSQRGEVRRKSRSPAVVVHLSDRGRAKASEAARDKDGATTAEASAGGEEVEADLEEAAKLRKLEARDREVRQHELAHKTTAGRYAVSGPHYQYEKGPDGRSYAIGGHVKLDISPVPGDPEATMEKMRVIRRAALAPAEPSSSDRRIAATASAQLKRAQLEAQQQQENERAAERSPSEDPEVSVPESSAMSARPTAVA